MSQILSQDTPLQNCTNTLKKPQDTPMFTPMKQSKLFDCIDLTGTKVELKSPNKSKAFAFVIDEIVISDSDDESPPKRIKNTETPNSTPQKYIPKTNLHKTNTVIVKNSPKLKPKIYSPNPSKIVSTLKSNIKTSTPVHENGHLSEFQVSSPVYDSKSHTKHKRLSDIKRPAEVRNLHEEEQLMPTDITTVELFESYSGSNTNNIQFKKQVNHRTSECFNENTNSSLPEPDFLSSIPEVMQTASSQLAEHLQLVGIKDSSELKMRNSPKTMNLYSPDAFYTPECSPLTTSSPVETSVFFPTAVPHESSPNKLTLDKLEENRKRYIPDRTRSNPELSLIVGKELSDEWIDDMINVPLDSQTTFAKLNSLQFIHSYITTPRVKITTPLLTPIVTCLIQAEDGNIALPVSTLLNSVIKTHPAVTASNIDCYTSVFTWEILTSSLEVSLAIDQHSMRVESLLKLYCDIMQSENSYSHCDNKISFIRGLFWPANSGISMSSNLKGLIDYASKLFFKQNSFVCWLFKMLEHVLAWSMEHNEVIWHVEAALEFRNQFSKLDSQSYSQLIESLNPPWFAGYLAQKRLQEISVSPTLNLELYTNLTDLFLNYAYVLPSHPRVDVPPPTDKFGPLDCLIKASHSGDCEAIKQFINEGCSPNACDVKKWSSLHRACYSGKVRSVEAIVQASQKRGIYLNIIQKNALGATPMHIAAKCGNAEVCECLLNIGGPSLLFQRDENQKMPSQVTTNTVLIDLLKRGDTFAANSGNCKQNSKLRIPFELAIIHEFELMLCLAIFGVFTQGKFTTKDLLACQKAENFISSLKLRINRSQLEPVELRRLTTLVYSLFA